MNALVRFAHRTMEKVRGVFYEGPEPPTRITDMVVVFSNSHPSATKADWASFASAHARESYRSGYTRGLQWAERDKDRREGVDPEMMMRQLDPDFEWLDVPVTIEDPDAIVPTSDPRDPRRDVAAFNAIGESDDGRSS